MFTCEPRWYFYLEGNGDTEFLKELPAGEHGLDIRELISKKSDGAQIAERFFATNGQVVTERGMGMGTWCVGVIVDDDTGHALFVKALSTLKSAITANLLRPKLWPIVRTTSSNTETL